MSPEYICFFLSYESLCWVITLTLLLSMYTFATNRAWCTIIIYESISKASLCLLIGTIDAWQLGTSKNSETLPNHFRLYRVYTEGSLFGTEL
ncbi:hypothetical protein CPB84DRAFT_1774930 [Gymnopilus junonius]|uniref:Uncharacterized protein n=1 Tax=Gymnopilus junonius TaxID=109634 RepID=A0A9P5NS38_GYMJU|nr:hypothetical protein CPB84DRAFT_1774930 [Gymnopilus junonius]